LNVSKDLPFCNPKLSLNERLDDLISRLTLAEKQGLISPDILKKIDDCTCMDSGVPRLGIPSNLQVVWKILILAN
jgi:hypothetical protein